MRKQSRDAVIRQISKYEEERHEVKNETMSIRASNKKNRYFATNNIFASKKLYTYQLFIGDSKQPIGNFSLTLRDASRRNKDYRNKLFNSSDESYRMRTLHLTDESREQLKLDIDLEIIAVSKRRREILKTSCKEM